MAGRVRNYNMCINSNRSVYTFHRSQYEQIDNLQLYSKIINIPPIQNQRHFFTFLASLIQVKLTSFKIFLTCFIFIFYSLHQREVQEEEQITHNFE